MYTSSNRPVSQEAVRFPPESLMRLRRRQTAMMNGWEHLWRPTNSNSAGDLLIHRFMWRDTHKHTKQVLRTSIIQQQEVDNKTLHSCLYSRPVKSSHHPTSVCSHIYITVWIMVKPDYDTEVKTPLMQLIWLLMSFSFQLKGKWSVKTEPPHTLCLNLLIKNKFSKHRFHFISRCPFTGGRRITRGTRKPGPKARQGVKWLHSFRSRRNSAGKYHNNDTCSADESAATPSRHEIILNHNWEVEMKLSRCT